MPISTDYPATWIDATRDGAGYARVFLPDELTAFWADANEDDLELADIWIEEVRHLNAPDQYVGRDSGFARPNWFQANLEGIPAEGGNSRYYIDMGVNDELLVVAEVTEVLFGMIVTDGTTPVEAALWVRTSIYVEASGPDVSSASFWWDPIAEPASDGAAITGLNQAPSPAAHLHDMEVSGGTVIAAADPSILGGTRFMSGGSAGGSVMCPRNSIGQAQYGMSGGDGYIAFVVQPASVGWEDLWLRHGGAGSSPYYLRQRTTGAVTHGGSLVSGSATHSITPSAPCLVEYQMVGTTVIVSYNGAERFRVGGWGSPSGGDYLAGNDSGPTYWGFIYMQLTAPDPAVVAELRQYAADNFGVTLAT